MSRLVYSTDLGRRCPSCGQASTECVCKNANNSAPSGDGMVRIRRETKGRKGKGVSIVSGVLINAGELKTLGKELRQKLSTGGAIKGNDMEFQGDQRQALKILLESKGYTVKLSGA